MLFEVQTENALANILMELGKYIGEKEVVMTLIVIVIVIVISGAVTACCVNQCVTGTIISNHYELRNGINRLFKKYNKPKKPKPKTKKIKAGHVDVE